MKIRLNFKYILKPQKINQEIIEDIMWHCAKVYNTFNYELQKGKEEIHKKRNRNIESSRIYKRYREENWHSKYLHAHTLQEVLLDVLADHKSYIALTEKYERGDKQIKGKPRFPRYKRKNNIQITFTKYAIRREGNVLKLSISKEMQEKFKVKSLNFLIPKKLRKLVNFEAVKMIRIQKEETNYAMNIIYEKEEKKQRGSNIMAIDLGLNNMAACTNANNHKSFIIAGESLKSKIRYYNKEIAKYQGIQMKMVGSKKYKNTKRIRKLYKKRKQYVNTYLHKASRMIVDYAIKQECNTIIIGDIQNIKQNMKNNRSFVQLPLQELVKKISYKARLEGIDVEKIKENYTSGVSSIDKEEICKVNYHKERRIKRGLFRSNTGVLINADINGSINIMRKYLKNISPNLEIAMDIGREQRPLKKRVA
ncbi:MAG: RNA-guided endonuclease InsQ/TnpB family protein [Clostridia bacterium]